MRSLPKLPGLGTLAQLMPSLASDSVLDSGTFHANRIGGTLTVFAPFAIAVTIGALSAAFDPKRTPFGALQRLFLQRRWRLTLIFITLIILFILVLTQSRSAWLGTAIGIGVVLLFGGRWSRLLLSVGIVLGAVFLLTSSGQLLLGYIGDELSLWRYSQSGLRIDVWRSSLQAIRDFPFSGIGLGHFSIVINRIYPTSVMSKQLGAWETVEFPHAHNLFLQTGVDLGLLGAFLLLAILMITAGILILLVKRSPSNTFSRYWHVGLLGSLFAYLAYSMSDAIGLGERSGFPMWLLLGLSMLAFYISKFKLVRVRRITRRTAWLLIVFSSLLSIVLLGLLLSPTTRRIFRHNVATQQVLHAYLNDSDLAAISYARLEQLIPADCRAYYWLGLTASILSRPDLRDSDWSKYIECDPGAVDLLQGIAGNNLKLAEYAALNSRQGKSAFWLARNLVEEDPQSAIVWLQRGLELVPNDALQWSLLGKLLENHDVRAAMDAYWSACQRGDPPIGGCRAAGRLAAQANNDELANFYYLSSPRFSTRALAERHGDEKETGKAPTNDSLESSRK